jgi:hypothetical protein
MTECPEEATVVHTRLLRITLAVDESQAYWENAAPDLPSTAMAGVAFEGRWFGGKSAARVRQLLHDMASRYAAFPESLAVLRRWSAMSAATRRLVCHWHLQLSDPLYRRFSGLFLTERRAAGAAAGGLTRDLVARWVRAEGGERWAPATCVQFASKLLTTAFEAGLVAGRRDPRPLATPRIPDDAVAYLLYLLRGIRFAGTLFDNPYLASVGLTGPLLDARIAHLDDLTLRRIGDVVDVEWRAPSLEAWGASL